MPAAPRKGKVRWRAGRSGEKLGAVLPREDLSKFIL